MSLDGGSSLVKVGRGEVVGDQEAVSLDTLRDPGVLDSELLERLESLAGRLVGDGRGESDGTGSGGESGAGDSGGGWETQSGGSEDGHGGVGLYR